MPWMGGGGGVRAVKNLLHSNGLYGVLALLSAVGLIKHYLPERGSDMFFVQGHLLGLIW